VVELPTGRAVGIGTDLAHSKSALGVNTSRLERGVGGCRSPLALIQLPCQPSPGRGPREEPSAPRCRRTRTNPRARGQLGALFVLFARFLDLPSDLPFST
jgi:hypothetical protein